LSIKKIPDYRLKQKILYIDNTDAETLKKYGDLFLEVGNISDALDFYNKAKYFNGIESIKEMSFDSGDVMIFERAMKILSKEPSPAQWEKIGQKAISLKKYYFAKYVLEKTGKQEEINSL
jgi:tetratricopeptide (TPR) repeat protein